MQHSKYQELRNMIAGIQSTCDAKLAKQEKIVNGMMLVIKDYDAQVQTLKALLFAAGTISPADYDAQADMRRGLRVRKPDEPIEAGDVAWVDFHATVENDEIKKAEVVGFEQGMPVRVGSGGVSFDEALIGQVTGATIAHTEKVKEDGPLNGKDITFNVTIRKVKTKLTAKDMETTDGQSGDAGNRSADHVEENTEPATDLAGRGHEPSGHSEPVAVQ